MKASLPTVLPTAALIVAFASNLADSSRVGAPTANAIGDIMKYSARISRHVPP